MTLFSALASLILLTTPVGDAQITPTGFSIRIGPGGYYGGYYGNYNCPPGYYGPNCYYYGYYGYPYGPYYGGRRYYGYKRQQGGGHRGGKSRSGRRR